MLTPEPRPTGGVPGMARLTAVTLASLGAEVDCYFPVENEPPASHATVAPRLPNLRWLPCDLGWRWSGWYADAQKRPLLTNASQLTNRAVAASSVGRRVQAEHRRHPYDLVYRFSTIELIGLRQRLASLPPVVLHPEVHAAGEWAWLVEERADIERCTTTNKRRAVEFLMSRRASAQHGDLHAVARVITPSDRFAEHLSLDHGLSPRSMSTVPNPIDLKRFHPRNRTRSHRGDYGEQHVAGGTVVFVGRIAVRKGIADLVDLSHRLATNPLELHETGGTARRLHLDVIGGPSHWNDLRLLLQDLHPDTASYHEALPLDAVAKALANADLVVQPSAYEPFALTVGEALASGTPVVVTTEVGAGEHLHPDICRRVAAHDGAALHAAVVTLANEMRDPARAVALRALARREAQRRFAPATVAQQLLNVFDDVVADHVVSASDARSHPAPLALSAPHHGAAKGPA